MSTRSQIGFYPSRIPKLSHPDAVIYKHSDGYPSGNLPLLVPFLRLFNERRGLTDTEYASAWTLWHLINEHVKQSKKWKFSSNKDGIDCLGYGICGGHGKTKDCFHEDIAYYYAVRPTCLETYHVVGPTIASWKLLKTISLGETVNGRFSIPSFEWLPLPKDELNELAKLLSDREPYVPGKQRDLVWKNILSGTWDVLPNLPDDNEILTSDDLFELLRTPREKLPLLIASVAKPLAPVLEWLLKRKA